MTQEIAYCFANGVIKFASKEAGFPDGALPLGSGPSGGLRRKVEALARLTYDNVTLLVPGVPEAKNQDEALDAVIFFSHILKKRLKAAV